MCSAAITGWGAAMRTLAPIVLLLSAAPAAASGGTEVPEPSSLAIFGLGVLGVIVGRQAAKRRADDDA